MVVKRNFVKVTGDRSIMALRLDEEVPREECTPLSNLPIGTYFTNKKAFGHSRR